MFEWLFARRVYYKEISVIDGDSIHCRKGGWGADGQQSEGEIPYRLEGVDAPELAGRQGCKSEREARWGEAAKIFLDQQLQAARKLKLRDLGPLPRGGGTRLAALTIDGVDAADVMIDARMAKQYRWRNDGGVKRWDWDDLWDERPDVLR